MESVLKQLAQKAKTYGEIGMWISKHYGDSFKEWQKVWKGKWVSLEDLKDFVVVPRKQLSDIIDEEKPITLVEGLQHGGRIALAKELFEAGLENIPHEKETEK